MKITQSQLRQIIKEELSSIVSEDSASDQMAVDKVREVVELWNESYNNLPDDESRALFEDFLNQNLKAYTEMWQRDRNEPLEREKEREQFQREEDEFALEEGEKWIQDAEKDIERRGTEGVCTGDKFGGPDCPPDTKRYNLAKTFRKMAKKRKKD